MNDEHSPQEADSDAGSPIVAGTGTGPLMVVGLGASAGGLEALDAFFSCMPADSGLAFVVVTHLPLEHTSMLPSLLGRRTAMPVTEVVEGVALEPNRVYVSMPGRHMELADGQLRLVDAGSRARVHLPIDQFFRSLAREVKERAVGIVLSGTGSDGTVGLKEIKCALGLSIVQTEETARFSGMPRSAIRGDHPDFVCPVAEMPKHLLAFRDGTMVAHKRAAPEQAADDAGRPDALEAICATLRARSGHDFSAYKTSTVRRRIERRMTVLQVESAERYADYVAENPSEADTLFDELLIGVTSFFRDSDAFDGLEALIDALITGRTNDEMVRVWVAGCSTGEEAYSIAILLRERMERAGRSLPVQIFATDLDARAIDVARAGSYPDGIVADVSSERLQRFFVRTSDSYRVKKEVREMLVFATQNLVEDPPFTKLDLLSCRNLLIYFGAKLQQRLIPLFHYSLKPAGTLFLGSSESLGNFGTLFEVVDKKWKLFRRREVSGGTYVAEIPASVVSESLHSEGSAVQMPPRRMELNMSQVADKVLLRELVPPTALVRERGDIVHIHGRTGLFLEPASGPQTSANIFNMAREGLDLELAAAIRQATHEDGEVVRRGVRIKNNGSIVTTDLRVRRLDNPEAFRGLLLVSFVLAQTPDANAEVPVTVVDVARVAELERELHYTRENHQGTVEELETANEELKSVNEEMQSTNEELQSTNEELETSKEELQSLNEELQTVNVELQEKVEELSRANDDMTNLLNATDIATVFLDNNLHIKRHTEQAKRIIRLIPSDVGRPIGDLVSRLRYDRLVEDAHEVLRTLTFKEGEVQGPGDEWFLMRMLPYRTTGNVIDGLVITFVDITRVKSLQQSEGRMLPTLRNAAVYIFGQDRDLRVSWACSDVFGYKPEQALGKTGDDLFGSEPAKEVEALQREIMKSGTSARKRVELHRGPNLVPYQLYLEADRAQDGEVVGVTCVAVDARADTSSAPDARQSTQAVDVRGGANGG